MLTTDQEAKAKRIPPHLRGMYRRGLDGSRAAAIWLHCLECVAWAPSEVRACTARGCVLYPYRYRGSTAGDEAETDAATPAGIGDDRSLKSPGDPGDAR